jgi:GTP-binding protein
MIIQEAEFVKSVGQLAQLPKDDLPQIAFCGRSNVGKSSLINSLLNRRNLAKTSNIPGKTRQLNFYRITRAGATNRSFYFVDLPGYGYAKVSHSEREHWQQLIEKSFYKSQSLCGVIAVIDSRHGATTSDLELLLWLTSLSRRSGVVVVATKADKLSNKQLAEKKREIETAIGHFPIAGVVFYSALTALGRREVWRHVNEFLEA